MAIHCGPWQRSRSVVIARLCVAATCLVAAGCGDGDYRLGGAGPQQEALQPSDVPTVGLCANGADVELIDQMEDGDGAINLTGGRAGVWFAFNDGTGTQFPKLNVESFPMAAVDPERSGSRYAARTYGSGFTTWGGGIGFDLLAQHEYDASTYAGIAFWARRAPGATAAVRLVVIDGATSPLGDECDFVHNLCHDDFGSDLELGTAFHHFSFAWADLTQRGWSGQILPSVDASRLYGVRFQTDASVDFDFWIDDVALLCRAD
jgi:hypothetical protein